MSEARERALALAEEAARPLGLVVVNVTLSREGGRRVLRAVVDRPGGGVTFAELEPFARAFGRLLDADDPVEGEYQLETQSPGVNRTLRDDREFEVLRGRSVRVTTYPPERRRFEGELLGLRDGEVALRLADGSEVGIPRRSVAKAQLWDGGDDTGD